MCILQTEIEAIRDDIAPTWLQHPLSLEQTADKYVRPSLQQVKSAVCLASSPAAKLFSFLCSKCRHATTCTAASPCVFTAVHLELSAAMPTIQKHHLVSHAISAMLCASAYNDVSTHAKTPSPDTHESVTLSLLLIVVPSPSGFVALQTFIDLCRQPVAAYLDRFNFKSPLLKSMYAVTDGFSGLNGSWQTPGTGMNFLMHNMVSHTGKGLTCL